MAALTPSAPPALPCSLDWGVAERPRAGATESGDRGLVQPFPGGTLLAVVDGLGHGEPAAAAARQAIAVLAENAAEPVDRLVERCHAALASTRGVVMSLASVDAGDLSVSWIGIGNVEAWLLRSDAGARPAAEPLLLRPGVVGQKVPGLPAWRVAGRPGDLLVMATDGVRSGFEATARRRGPCAAIAGAILAGHGRAHDDALVLAARLPGDAA